MLEIQFEKINEKTYSFISLPSFIRDEYRITRKKSRRKENNYVFRRCPYKFKTFIQKFHFLQKSDIFEIKFHILSVEIY